MQKVQKRATVLTLALLLAFSLTAGAVSIQPRYNVTTKCTPKLTYTGTTANCNANIAAQSGAKIEGTMTLYRVSGSKTEVASWPVSGTTSVNTTKTTGVTKGQTYQLVLDVTVTASNGRDQISEDVTATCS